MSRRIEVEFYNPSCAYVRGHGARERLQVLRGGRVPVWAVLSRAWVTQPETAEQLMVQCQREGIEVLLARPGTFSNEFVPVSLETPTGGTSVPPDETPAPVSTSTPAAGAGHQSERLW